MPVTESVTMALDRIEMTEKIRYDGTIGVHVTVQGNDEIAKTARYIVARMVYLFNGETYTNECSAKAYKIHFYHSEEDVRIEDLPATEAAKDISSLQSAHDIHEVISLETKLYDGVRLLTGQIYVAGKNEVMRRLCWLVRQNGVAHSMMDPYILFRDKEDLKLSELPVQRAVEDVESLRKCRASEVFSVPAKRETGRAVSRPLI